MRELRKQGFNKGEIARLAGINRATVAKYLKEDFDPSSPYYNTTIPSKIKPYAKDIKDMLSEGKTFRQISAAIREKGYDGSDSTIRMFATRERKIMKETAVPGFKQTLFGKKTSELDKWLEETDALEIDELSSFTNGVRRDIAAVKNAILLDYHNGLAEGSVNKLKVVKRIMYGRNSFEMLKGKLLRLELNRKIN